MAFAIDYYIASESQTDFTITFGYLDGDDVVVHQNGSLLTEGASDDYTIVSTTTMRLTSGATAGDIIRINRSTSRSARLVDYASASTLTEEDLDNDSLQAFYMAQEAIDLANVAIKEVQGHFSLSDDAATSFSVPSATDTGVFSLIVKNSPELFVEITYRAESAAAEANTLVNVTSGSVTVTTGALAGTTGTDGQITVAPATDGKIYIENRSGGTLQFGYNFRGAL